MKKLITLLLLFVSISIFSQEYNVGAINAAGYTVKIGGKVIFQDDQLIISYANKDKEVVTQYTIIEEVNGITYVTDGMQTFEAVLTELSKPTKVAGFKATNSLTFSDSKSNVKTFFLTKA